MNGLCSLPSFTVISASWMLLSSFPFHEYDHFTGKLHKLATIKDVRLFVVVLDSSCNHRFNGTVAQFIPQLSPLFSLLDVSKIPSSPPKWPFGDLASFFSYGLSLCSLWALVLLGSRSPRGGLCLDPFPRDSFPSSASHGVSTHWLMTGKYQGNACCIRSV